MEVEEKTAQLSVKKMEAKRQQREKKDGREKLHIAQISMKNRSRIAFFLYSSFFIFLDFGIFALHSLVENLNVGEDGFPIRRIEGHHVLHVQKRVHPEFFVRNLEGPLEVLLPGLGGEFVHWDFSRAEMVDQSHESHAIRPRSREILNVDVAVAAGFVLDPE